MNINTCKNTLKKLLKYTLICVIIFEKLLKYTLIYVSSYLSRSTVD
jgi:hypothetical protein